MNKDCLHSVARRRILGFCIKGNFYRLCQICFLVDVQMTNAICMTQNRNRGILHDIPDKLVGPAGYEQVDFLLHSQHQSNVSMAFHKQEPRIAQCRAAATSLDGGNEFRIGSLSLPSPLENDAIAALEAERDNLYQGIGPGLKDHADDTYGEAHLFEQQAVIETPALQYLPNGIFQRGNLMQTKNDRSELILAENQTLNQGFLLSVFHCLGNIRLVRLLYQGKISGQAIGDGQEELVALLYRAGGEDFRLGAQGANPLVQCVCIHVPIPSEWYLYSKLNGRRYQGEKRKSKGGNPIALSKI
ncbi:hypothetical protein SDC9_87127 [bioreactor metagenome]|uniref:Uncharacterized protein n=1 Tax=bioreactor metagenome TaxID=1076179 RepID=A0A644ZP61_9ZZZZ